jgi:peptidoglycan/LPS O-acetylase OafA/YrhL
MSTASPTLSWRNPRLTGRVPELDGVRGLAILLVLVWHYVGCATQGVTPRSWQAYFLASLHLTWTGVDLFFILSGFLIGGILYDAKDSKSYYRTFYFRRIYRIFPLYFIWLALFIIGLYLVGPDKAGRFGTVFNRDLPVWTYPLFLQNFSMTLKNTFGPYWMQITWSLAVEEQFYLLLPALVRNLSTRGITRLATAAIVCAPLVRLALWLSGNSYFGPYTLLPSRADALGFGVLVALTCRNEEAWEWFISRRNQLYWALFVLGCGFFVLLKYQRFLYVFGLTWIAAFYALLFLLTLLNPEGIETRCLRTPLLLKFGAVSYAVYLFHVGINEFFHFAILGRLPGFSDSSSLLVTLLSVVTIMSLAELSWRFLEKPLMRHAHAIYRY